MERYFQDLFIFTGVLTEFPHVIYLYEFKYTLYGNGIVRKYQLLRRSFIFIFTGGI